MLYQKEKTNESFNLFIVDSFLAKYLTKEETEVLKGTKSGNLPPLKDF